MPFDATTPYALACLSDNARSVQSLSVLREQAPAEARVEKLIELANSWNIEMSEDEAQCVVDEYDAVLEAEPKAAGLLGGVACAS